MANADSPVRTVAAAAGQAVLGSGTLHGGCLKVSQAATVDVYDATSAAGKLLFTFTVAAAGTAAIPSLDRGVRFETGLFFATSAGTITGSVWVIA